MFIEAIRRAAQIRGDCDATICGDRKRSWRQSMDRCSRLSASLRRLGLSPGDRVGILSCNSDYYVEAIHAIWWGGAVVVPMNNRWAINEHVYSIDDADITAIFVSDEFVEIARELQSLRPDIDKWIYMGGHAEIPEGFLGLENMIASETPAPAVMKDRNELAGIFYTGGTTGRPKGVMHSSLSLWSGAMAIAMDSRPPAFPRYLHAAPMFHLGDLIPGFSCTALAGTHTFVPRFSEQGVIDIARRDKIQFLLLLPTMIGMLLEHEAFDPKDFESVELMVFGGSPISEALLNKLQGALPNARLVQAFGQSESAAAGAIFPDAPSIVAQTPERIRAAGRPNTSVELSVFNEDGESCPTREAGEIWLRSPSAMLGYWNMPEQTQAAFQDGWLRTGDAGYLDEDGYLYVCDRVKDMIISGGENIFSAEVENAISTHPKVQQVAVIGVPDDKWGERVHAVIVPKGAETLALEELQAHCRPNIAGYKIPRSIELRASALPLSPVGKVLKTELRAPHWSGKGRDVN